MTTPRPPEKFLPPDRTPRASGSAPTRAHTLRLLSAPHPVTPLPRMRGEPPCSLKAGPRRSRLPHAANPRVRIARYNFLYSIKIIPWPLLGSPRRYPCTGLGEIRPRPDAQPPARGRDQLPDRQPPREHATPQHTLRGRPVAGRGSGRTAMGSRYAARPSSGSRRRSSSPVSVWRGVGGCSKAHHPPGGGRRGTGGIPAAGGNRVGTARGSHLPPDLHFCVSKWEPWERTSAHAHRNDSFYRCTGVRGGWFPPFPRFASYPQVSARVGTAEVPTRFPPTGKGAPNIGAPIR